MKKSDYKADGIIGKSLTLIGVVLILGTAYYTNAQLTDFQKEWQEHHKIIVEKE